MASEWDLFEATGHSRVHLQVHAEAALPRALPNTEPQPGWHSSLPCPLRLSYCFPLKSVNNSLVNYESLFLGLIVGNLT